MIVRPDPKPVRRIVDPEALREFRTRALDEGWPCQVCGGNGLSTTRTVGVEVGHFAYVEYVGFSVHHVVSRGQGGDDLPTNFAWIDGHGTLGCHGDLEHRRNGARERLRENMTPEQVAYAVEKCGEAWLARHYPARAA